MESTAWPPSPPIAADTPATCALFRAKQERTLKRDGYAGAVAVRTSPTKLSAPRRRQSSAAPRTRDAALRVLLAGAVAALLHALEALEADELAPAACLADPCPRVTLARADERDLGVVAVDKRDRHVAAVDDGIAEQALLGGDP